MAKKKPRPGHPRPAKPRVEQPRSDGVAAITPYRMRVLMTIGMLEKSGENNVMFMAERTGKAVGTFMHAADDLRQAGLVNRSYPMRLTKKGQAVWNAVTVALGLQTEPAKSEKKDIRPLSQILRGEP